jgi:hypothetical protein
MQIKTFNGHCPYSLLQFSTRRGHPQIHNSFNLELNFLNASHSCNSQSEDIEEMKDWPTNLAKLPQIPSSEVLYKSFFKGSEVLRLTWYTQFIPSIYPWDFKGPTQVLY